MENSKLRLSHLLGGFVTFLTCNAYRGDDGMNRRSSTRHVARWCALSLIVCSLGINETNAQDLDTTGFATHTDQWLIGIINRDLRYVESSVGLEPPRWDGGRTTLAIADLNDDGHLDIVSVGDHGSPFVNTDLHGLSVWFGDGTGQWSSFQTGSFGYGGVAIGDVNNDGLLDAGWGVHHDYSSTDLGDQVQEVALGDGTGRNWTPWDDGLGDEGQSWGMFGTVLGDWNVDGWLDLASVAFGCCDGYHIYLNNTDGSWTHTQGALGGNSSVDIATGDINNDGFPDLATSHDAGTAWLGNGDGTFINIDATLPNNGSRIPAGVALGDITGDGQDELAYANNNGGFELLHWDANTLRWIDVSENLPDTGDWSVVRLSDMDGDGRLDVIGFGDGLAAVLLQRQSTTGFKLGATVRVPGPGSYAGFEVADIDHNGRPDMVIVSEQGGFFNSRNEMQVFKEASSPARVALDVVAPVANRVWRDGMATTVRWQAAIPFGLGTPPSAVVDLHISLEGQDGPWLEVATDLPNNGHRQITVNDGGAPRPDAYLRVTLRTDAYGSIDAIVGPLEIR